MKLSSDFTVFFDILTGYRKGHILMVLAQSKVCDYVYTKSRNAENICKILNWDREYGIRFLDAAARLGYLDKEGEYYSPSCFSRKFLYSKSPEYQGDTLVFEKRLIQSWGSLQDVLTRGERTIEPKSEEEYNTALRTFLGAMDNSACIRCEELWTSIKTHKNTYSILLRWRELFLNWGRDRGGTCEAFLKRTKDGEVFFAILKM